MLHDHASVKVAKPFGAVHMPHNHARTQSLLPFIQSEVECKLTGHMTLLYDLDAISKCLRRQTTRTVEAVTRLFIRNSFIPDTTLLILSEL